MAGGHSGQPEAVKPGGDGGMETPEGEGTMGRIAAALAGALVVLLLAGCGSHRDYREEEWDQRAREAEGR